MNEKTNMEKYKRQSVFSELKKYDVFAKDHSYIEVTEWKNGDGFDVDINSTENNRFQLTNGEFRALKKMIKILHKSH